MPPFPPQSLRTNRKQASCRSSRRQRAALPLLLGGAALFCTTAAHADTARLTPVHSFQGSEDGFVPNALILGNDGSLYGTTFWGTSDGRGGIFRLSTAGQIETLYSFSLGGSLSAAGIPDGLIQARDGNLYGTMYAGGPRGYGVLYVMPTAGTPAVLYAFDRDGSGNSPTSAPLQASDGNFYGTTVAGGSYNHGTIYRISAAGAMTTLYAFPAATSVTVQLPGPSLIEGSDGNLYGTGGDDGAYAAGSIYRLTPDGAFTTLHSFSGPDGSQPQSALVQARDGNFYGTTSTGGTSGAGTLFRMTPAGVVTTLHSFTGVDGASPVAALIQGSDGALYGTTAAGGINSAGTVFRITTNGDFTSLCAFAGVDGRAPRAALVQAGDGYLYGITKAGGAYDGGTAFRLSTHACPVAPTGLSATAGDSEVTLNWVAANGATSYEIRQGTRSAGEAETPVLTGVTGTRATIKGLDNGTPYYFTVAAVYADDSSGPSNEASATPQHPVPAAPSGLQARADLLGRIRLRWTASPDATGYVVFQGEAPGAELPAPVLSGISATQATIKGLKPSTTYYFKVAAVNAYGTSQPSNEASAKTR